MKFIAITIRSTKIVSQFLLFCFLLIGCSNQYESQSIEVDSVNFRVTLKNLKFDNERSFIYGDLTISSTQKISNVNLNCISLEIDKFRNEKVYVDSVAHILAENYSVEDKEKVKINVYWTFVEQINESSIPNFSLKLNREQGGLKSCIVFSKQ